MKKDDTLYIQQILSAITKINKYINGMTFDDFASDDKTQSAVLMQLHVIGELAKRVSLDLREKIDLPWKAMAGMRDIISHQYFGVDLDEVWVTMHKSLPSLVPSLESYLNKQQ